MFVEDLKCAIFNLKLKLKLEIMYSNEIEVGKLIQ